MPIYTVKVDDDGKQEIWTNSQGNLHREHGPARILPSGRKEWWRNGNLHRDSGPAIYDDAGYKSWFVDGLLHNDKGPAIINSNGIKSWFLKGEELSEAQFLHRTAPHTITIDGKTISISTESYEALKESLGI